MEAVHAPTQLEVEGQELEEQASAMDSLLATCEGISARLRAVLCTAKHDGCAGSICPGTSQHENLGQPESLCRFAMLHLVP